MEIFVFASNLGGRHGRGSALEAFQSHGAILGQGIGLQGRSYGIPTKSRDLKTLDISEIAVHVKTFLEFAKNHPEMTFRCVKIGCGLAGLSESEMIPLFAGASENVNLPDGWRT